MRFFLISIFFIFFERTTKADEVKNWGETSKIETEPSSMAKLTTYIVNHECSSSCLTEAEEDIFYHLFQCDDNIW